ncbi:hypothetical protein Gotur_018525 [Gossypium turneri]
MDVLSSFDYKLVGPTLKAKIKGK